MILAGVDEAGRGSLAGPVVAAAVIINDSIKIEGIRDSKDLSKNQRSALEEKIKQLSTCWSIAWASVEEIERINIIYDQSSNIVLSFLYNVYHIIHGTAHCAFQFFGLEENKIG